MRLRRGADRESVALLWEEARRQVEEQRSTLESLRSRSLALLSAASLVAAFFGTHLLHGTHNWWVAPAITVALVAFGFSVLAVVWVLKPRTKEWEFYQALDPYVTDLEQGTDVPEIEILFNLAADTDLSWYVNEAILSSLHWWFRWACLFLGIQALAWAIAVL